MVFIVITFASVSMATCVLLVQFVFVFLMSNYLFKEICMRQCHDDIVIHGPEGDVHIHDCDGSNMSETIPVQLVDILASSDKEQ